MVAGLKDLGRGRRPRSRPVHPQPDRRRQRHLQAVARGYFQGVDFSPKGDYIVYARARADRFPYRSDIFRAPTDTGRPTPLTTDHRSQYPLIFPADERIAFVKLVDAKRRRYGPKNEIYVMRSDGRRVRRLTRTKVDPLLTGLVPIDLSDDGTRLLAQFGGQDTSYAQAVNAVSGRQRPVEKRLERGLIATAVTADGRTILGATGGYEPDAEHLIVAVSWGGKRVRVLARNGFNPHWNR